MRICLLLILLTATGCSDFDPRSLLKGPRVLGIVAEPPEIRLGTPVQLTSIEYNPETIERTWSVCLLSLGAFADFACLDEDLLVPLEQTGPSVEFIFDPAVLGAFFGSASDLDIEECGQACLGRDGTPRTFIDAQVTLDTKWADGTTMKTIKAVRIRIDDVALNTNPVATSMRINDSEQPPAASPGDRVIVSVEIPDMEPETYVDTGGRTRTEEVTLTWYSSAGEFDPAITFGNDHDTVLILPKDLDAPEVELMVVVRDGRGGTAYQQVTLPIQ